MWILSRCKHPRSSRQPSAREFSARSQTTPRSLEGTGPNDPPQPNTGRSDGTAITDTWRSNTASWRDDARGVRLHQGKSAIRWAVPPVPSGSLGGSYFGRNDGDCAGAPDSAGHCLSELCRNIHFPSLRRQSAHGQNAERFKKYSGRPCGHKRWSSCREQRSHDSRKEE